MSSNGNVITINGNVITITTYITYITNNTNIDSEKQNTQHEVPQNNCEKRKREEENILDITDMIADIPDTYNLLSSAYKLLVLEYINILLLKKYSKPSIIMFNEDILYCGNMYNSFHNLYNDIIKPYKLSIKYHKKYFNNIDKLVSQIVLCKGGRCTTCLYPFDYIRNKKDVKRICYICRRIDYYNLHTDLENKELNDRLIYVNMLREERNINLKSLNHKSVMKAELDNIELLIQ